MNPDEIKAAGAVWPTTVHVGDLVWLTYHGRRERGIIVDIVGGMYLIVVDDHLYFPSVLRVREELVYSWAVNTNPAQKELST